MFRYAVGSTKMSHPNKLTFLDRVLFFLGGGNYLLLMFQHVPE